MCVCAQIAGLGSICSDDFAFTWYPIPAVASQQVQVREYETREEVFVASGLH